MGAKPAWILVTIFAMVLATLSPGVVFAVTSLSLSTDHAVASPSGAVTKVGAYNWAGYTATAADGTVTKVTGTWVQPAVNCANGKTTYLATWVGIDGFNTSDLQQTGTQAVCSGGVASYGAWWEVLPASETPISTITVHAGDTITASVTYSSGKFTMKITDGASSFSKTKVVSSTSRNSVDCIVERPTVGGAYASLAKFTKDTFSSCTATISGVTGGVGTFSTVYEINMYNNAGNKVIASTGALGSSKKSFSVTWKGY
jgi:hypothetical protein